MSTPTTARRTTSQSIPKNDREDSSGPTSMTSTGCQAWVRVTVPPPPTPDHPAAPLSPVETDKRPPRPPRPSSSPALTPHITPVSPLPRPPPQIDHTNQQRPPPDHIPIP